MDKNVAAGIPLQKAKQLVFLVFVLFGFLGEYSVAMRCQENVGWSPEKFPDPPVTTFRHQRRQSQAATQPVGFGSSPITCQHPSLLEALARKPQVSLRVAGLEQLTVNCH